MAHPMNRRGFLRLGVHAAASTTLLGTLGTLQRALAASDTSGYRALVCIYLHGGNDSFNTLVPRSFEGYAEYSQARGNLAIPRANLLPLRWQGGDYGVHPRCRPIQQLFNTGNLAFVANVGSLVEPVTRSDYLAGRARLPLQLFSHEDQEVQWMTGRADSAERKGWAGRVADLLAQQGYAPKLSMNISLLGTNVLQSADDVMPYILQGNRAPQLTVLRDSGDAVSVARQKAFLEVLDSAGADPSLMVQEFLSTQRRATELGTFVNDALAATPGFNTDFPADHLGQQLKVAASLIRARDRPGASRQIFFIGLGGFDTHDRQAEDHPELLASLSAGMQAFYDATQEMNAQGMVTTFTASEFGRTLTSNGDGTDHAWGAHHMVMGGAVRGRAIFGPMPSLAIDGPDNVDYGRTIPRQAMDQYGATLLRWFGVSESDLDLVFPNLQNFGSRNLGFMA